MKQNDKNQDQDLLNLLRQLPKQEICASVAVEIEQALIRTAAAYRKRKRTAFIIKQIGNLGAVLLLVGMFILFFTTENQVKNYVINWTVHLMGSYSTVPQLESDPKEIVGKETFHYQTYRLIGKEGYFGLYDKRFVSQTRNYLLLFLMESKTKSGPNSLINVLAVDGKKGEALTILEDEPLAPYLFEDAYSLSLEEIVFPYYGVWEIHILIDQKLVGNVPIYVQPSNKEIVVEEFMELYNLDFNSFVELDGFYEVKNYFEPYNEEITYYMDEITKAFVPDDIVRGTEMGDFITLYYLNEEEQILYALQKKHDGRNLLYELEAFQQVPYFYRSAENNEQQQKWAVEYTIKNYESKQGQVFKGDK